MAKYGRGKRIHRRRKRGSMLILTILCLYMLTLFFVALVGFMLMCYWLSHEQNGAEPIALGMAKMLNEDNSVGSLNDMTAASRELTFTTRTQWYQTQTQRYKYFADFATDIHNVSRESCGIIDQQRELLIQRTLKKLVNYVHDYNFRRRSWSPFDNVILESPTKIVDVELGTVDGIESSAYVPEYCPQLEEFDYESKVANSSSKLYLPKEQLSVPYDEDLTYVTSALPAQVEGNTAPPRLITPDHFRSFGKLIDNGLEQHLRLRQLPTAIRVTMETHIKNTDKVIQVTSLAVSHGAEAAPWQMKERQQN